MTSTPFSLSLPFLSTGSGFSVLHLTLTSDLSVEKRGVSAEHNRDQLHIILISLSTTRPSFYCPSHLLYLLPICSLLPPLFLPLCIYFLIPPFYLTLYCSSSFSPFFTHPLFSIHLFLECSEAAEWRNVAVTSPYTTPREGGSLSHTHICIHTIFLFVTFVS